LPNFILTFPGNHQWTPSASNWICAHILHSSQNWTHRWGLCRPWRDTSTPSDSSHPTCSERNRNRLYLVWICPTYGDWRGTVRRNIWRNFYFVCSLDEAESAIYVEDMTVSDIFNGFGVHLHCGLIVTLSILSVSQSKISKVNKGFITCNYLLSKVLSHSFSF